ncbi:hypothetical protein PENSPDRAFT_679130 [Peniophora sp. CONT]|nr:hypothetical protein PENSPDRAFT_679130 [Peniophora sp. CONT]
MPSRLAVSGLASLKSISSSTSWLPPRACRSLSYSARSARGRAAHKPAQRIAGARHFHSTRPSLEPKDPYQVLGVKKDATAADIKKVYFSLARKYHPDTNPDKNAQTKFVEIQEAYDILKDDKKRAAFDQYGSASQQPGFDPNAFGGQNPFGGGFGGFGGGFPGFGGSSFGGASQQELFDQLFGAFGGRARGPRGRPENLRGEDLNASVNISFMDAAKGVKRNVNVTKIVDCAPCTGSGMKPGAKRNPCTACNGTGTRTFVIESGFNMASTCSACSGTGSTVPRGSQCDSCGGVGKVRQRASVEVPIPAGVEDGMTVRVSKAGDAPMSGTGAPGDLLVQVKVTPSKVFRRQGSNLYHEAHIPLHTAVLGGRVRVPTLDGDVDVRVPGGTQQGEEMVLKSRGMPQIYRQDKGDLFVTFSVKLPRSLTSRQREILQLYADDVEGRASGPAQSPASDTAPAADTEVNGTRSSHPASSQSSGDGWLSRALRKIRELTS